MMPSAQKQQTTVSQAGGVTTTTTVTTTAPATTNFTQQELGTRSMARQIERQIDRMNQEKSQAPREYRGTLVDKDFSTGAEDFTFSSTADIGKVPERVRIILQNHEIDFNNITRIIHIPGATYFSISQGIGDEKKYSTYSLDEYIPPPPEDPYADDETEILTEDSVDSPENWNEQSFTIPVEAIEKELEMREKNLNALGTIGTVQSVTPKVAEQPINSLQTEIPAAAPAVSEPASAPKPIETIKLQIKELEPTSVESPLENSEKKLQEARLAAARENDAYYANKYQVSTLGTLNDLFGNDDRIHSELFKTITEYTQAKQNTLKEIGLQKWNLSKVVSWLKNEQIEKARLFSHEKYATFIKLATRFNLSVPSIVETRTGSFAMAPITKKESVTERLGIQHIDTKPHEFMWQALFSTTPSAPAVFNKKPEVLVTSIQPAEQPVATIVSEPILEKTTNRAAVFYKLYPIIKVALGVGIKQVVPAMVIPPTIENKKDEVITMKPSLPAVSVSVVTPSLAERIKSEPIIEQSHPDPLVMKPLQSMDTVQVVAQSASQPAVIPVVSNTVLSQKQHPENLFT